MAGYSQTSLQKKLGIKENQVLVLIGAPEDYLDWVSPLPEKVLIKKSLGTEVDFIHLFADRRQVFEAAFQKAKKALKSNGMLWVSWPKKSSKVPTDLDENIIREFGLKNGLVDVKVCAVTDVWSGLKFVYRLADR